jgi:hypothetical protein
MKRPKQAIQLTTGKVTPAQLAEKARALRATVLDSINEVDVRHIMAALVGRAKNGDQQAAEAVLKLIGVGQSEASAPGNYVQVNVDQGQPVRVTGGEVFDPRRLRVARLLAVRGALSPPAISEECEIPPTVIGSVLDYEWFQQTDRGVVLTAVGRAEIEDEDG